MGPVKHIELHIKHKGERDGWRICHGNDEFKPTLELAKGTTVRWNSPQNDAACLVFFDKSPFEKDGNPVRNEIVYISRNGKTETYTIADSATIDVKYEYAALVRGEGGDYTYVRGAESPPGVIVKPPR